MHRLWVALKLIGRWLGPAVLLLALYLFVFPLGPFWDLSAGVAIAGAAISAIVCLFMRAPERRKHRIMLAICSLAAFAFVGWRHFEEKRGYHEEIVSFDNRGAHLVGTLYLPDRPAKVPGIVWVHGSGGKLRSSLEPIVTHFARSGYAVLLYDKRGVGDSTGHLEEMNATSPENIELLASDASAALSLLAKRPEVRAKATGFVGVSQAGWIAPKAAVLNGNAAFMLLISGPVTSTHSFLRYERFHIGSFSEPTIFLARKAMGRGDIPDGMTADAAHEIAQKRIALDLPYSDYDPMTDLRRLDIPGLWLLGDGDWTVPPRPTAHNLDVLREEGKPYRYRYIPGASHGMYQGPKALVLETMDTSFSQVTKPTK